MNRVLLLLSLFICCLYPYSSSLAGNGYKIGVYYFPGWKDYQIGGSSALPWLPIKAFPEREPLQGWYDEGEDSNTEMQLKWMADYGIDYVVYDQQWGGFQNKPMLEHALNSYFRAANNKLVNFSILWANQGNNPASLDDFKSMVNYWVNNYFTRPQFQKIDGKPVIFILGALKFDKDATRFGKSTKELLDLANDIAISKGFSGIYFVGGIWADSDIAKLKQSVSGYSAYSAYNYHVGGKFNNSAKFVHSHTFDELDKGYQFQWEWFFKKADVPYILPMTSGWDKRPWGGTAGAPLHDNSVSTPQTFESHLLAAKAYMDKYPKKSLKTGIICCWNEYGEGSYIEPTKSQGFSYLEKIQKVFGGRVP